MKSDTETVACSEGQVNRALDYGDMGLAGQSAALPLSLEEISLKMEVLRDAEGSGSAGLSVADRGMDRS